MKNSPNSEDPQPRWRYPPMAPMEKAATVPPLTWSTANGRCLALRLPLDRTIARAARVHATAQLARIGLPRTVLDDVVSMVSELATNALEHGGHREPNGQRRQHDVAELWMYRRSTEHGPELVVKVFDSLRGWQRSNNEIDGTELLEHGRGLNIVSALSGGRCGHHPTRSRQSVPAVPGKAAWFALPIPRPFSFVQQQNRTITPAGAADHLRALLAARGVQALINKRQVGVAELSIHERITIWCQSHHLSWTAPDGNTIQLSADDITEACEQITQLHELVADGSSVQGA